MTSDLVQRRVRLRHLLEDVFLAEAAEGGKVINPEEAVRVAHAIAFEASREVLTNVAAHLQVVLMESDLAAESQAQKEQNTMTPAECVSVVVDQLCQEASSELQLQISDLIGRAAWLEGKKSGPVSLEDCEEVAAEHIAALLPVLRTVLENRQ